MKKTLLLTSALAALVATGCKKSPDVTRGQSAETTSEQMEKAKAATGEVAQQIQDYPFAQKTEFIAKMQAELVELNRAVDELSTKVENSSDAVKAEARPQLAALREQAKQLNRQLEDIARATPSTWNTIKADADKTYTALKDGVTRSRQWLSDKIAPDVETKK